MCITEDHRSLAFRKLSFISEVILSLLCIKCIYVFHNTLIKVATVSDFTAIYYFTESGLGVRQTAIQCKDFRNLVMIISYVFAFPNAYLQISSVK